MKKILLLSDTHGYLDNSILNHVSWADEVWHAGDIGDLKVTDLIQQEKPIKAVYGNIDGGLARKEFPLHQRFECEGKKIWITHIGGYPGRYDRSIRETIQQDPPDIFICGHSHILKVIHDKKLGLLHLNPGAIGKHGFHKVRTMLRFILDSGVIKDLEIIEFPR